MYKKYLLHRIRHTMFQAIEPINSDY